MWDFIKYCLYCLLLVISGAFGNNHKGITFKDIIVGNEKLMKEEEIEFSKTDDIGTVLYVAIDNKYVGYILIADKIKDDAKIAIESLKKNNVKKTVMLTGDKKSVGEDVAQKLGIDTSYWKKFRGGELNDLLKNDIIAIKLGKNAEKTFVPKFSSADDAISKLTNLQSELESLCKSNNKEDLQKEVSSILSKRLLSRAKEYERGKIYSKAIEYYNQIICISGK